MATITRLPFDAQHVADFHASTPSIPEKAITERKRYRTVWISDIHLGTRGCNAEMLIDFLDHVDCDVMYLVGDIIDGWALKKRFYWPDSHNDIVWRFLKRAKRGTEIVYIPGNHDEMFRQFSGLNFGGVHIRRQAIHTTADGRRLLVLHGDEFDAITMSHRWLAHLGDAAYEAMMGLNRLVNRHALLVAEQIRQGQGEERSRVHFEIRRDRRARSRCAGSRRRDRRTHPHCRDAQHRRRRLL